MTQPRRAPLYRVVIILLFKKNSMKGICSHEASFCIRFVTAVEGA